MNINFRLNSKQVSIDVSPSDTFLSTLRNLGLWSVKFGGCKKGECGACSVILNGKLVNSCSMLAVQADGACIFTVEFLGQYPDLGWKPNPGLHPIQTALIKSGAIQCGYCTPAMALAIKTLLDKEPHPSEAQIRQVLSGILCRCTGYLKPVQAALMAASELRGENNDQEYPSSTSFSLPSETNPPSDSDLTLSSSQRTQTKVIPRIKLVEQTKTFSQIGKPEKKVDAEKLVLGKPAFTADVEMRGLLIAKILHSPIAHARIKNIDTRDAQRLPGVAAVLTWKDLPRVAYSTAGQSDPIPGPLDTFSLDNKVRFVGDRVAFVAAETEEIATKALGLIKVDYEPLPVLLDPSKAMESGSPILHDEKEYVNFDQSDKNINLAARIHIDIGNVEEGFKQADQIFEGNYSVSKVQQAHIEPHVTITHWDEDDRLVIRTSTQVPFHVRRMLAPVLGLPIKRIRVIKPRIGGGFGGKQEVLIEDVAAHLTIATGRPVKIEYNRDEEFIAARSRHPMQIHLKTGVKNDGTITANAMQVLTDTGAYGCHALTVTGNTGHKAMALYVGDGEFRKSPNIRFYADIVYTNHPPAGAFRGYGVPQGFWAVERHMENICRKLGIDPIQFRLKNCLRSGELHPFSTAWSEGREPQPEIIQTVGLEECVIQGKAAIGWDQKYGNPEWHIIPGKPHLRKGIGIATVMQGTAIAYLDMGGASIKMNDDGSFNLLIGATDLGTGSDTVLAQMAAETLGVPTEDILVYSSDTDFTPFDKGAYASSTTYISGAAVVKAANQVADQIKKRAVLILSQKFPGKKYSSEEITLTDRTARTPDGISISFEQIGHHALHHANQEQIMAVGSFVSPVSPPPFAAQFAEVTVDIETGMVVVDKLVMAVDSGVIVNPITASGQIEGGMTQALGYAVCEEMTYDENGVPQQHDFEDYHIFRADEMPELETIFVETYEPTHPFGVKAVAEIPLDGVAPAVGNAVLDACGANVDSLPIAPEKVWYALNHLNQ